MPYAVYNLIVSFEKSSKDLLKWFDDNLTKSSPDKCHFLVSSCEKIKMVIGGLALENSVCKMFLGVPFVNWLSYIRIMQKANKRLDAQVRVTQYMNVPKSKILINAFFDWQFNYCTIGKMTGSTKDFEGLFITINSHHRFYLWKKCTSFGYWNKCLKSGVTFHVPIWTRFFEVRNEYPCRFHNNCVS